MKVYNKKSCFASTAIIALGNNPQHQTFGLLYSIQRSNFSGWKKSTTYFHHRATDFVAVIIDTEDLISTTREPPGSTMPAVQSPSGAA